MLNVSIIVPTHHRPDHLRQLLDSLENQTGIDARDWEVLIVDDGDSPAAHEVTRELIRDRKHPPIRYLPVTDRHGLCRARNQGVENCSGDVIVFLDDDMIADAALVQETLRVHRERPDILVLNGLIKEKRRDVYADFWRDQYHAVFVRPEPSPYPVSRVAGGHFSIKRSLLPRLGTLFDEALPSREDMDLALRLQAAEIPVYLCDRCVSYHDGRNSLRSYWQQRAWYEEGEIQLRRKYGAEYLQKIYRASPPAKTRARFIPLLLLARAARVWARFCHRWGLSPGRRGETVTAR